jgi:hypothetical protein
MSLSVFHRVAEEYEKANGHPNTPGTKDGFKLMFAAVTRAAQRWGAIKMTNAKRLQMKAASEELDRLYKPHGAMR